MLPLDIDRIERNEDTERHDRRDRSVELLADEILHVIALEPVIDVARRLVRSRYFATCRPGTSGREIS